MPPILIAILTYFWELLKTWFSLFAAPVYNLEMLWIIIPTYLNWIFADFFQEKKGTSLGNAISNAKVNLYRDGKLVEDNKTNEEGKLTYNELCKGKYSYAIIKS